MGLPQFLERFRVLHEQARKGELDPVARREYDRDRDELARVLLQAQKETPRPDERPRHALKVTKALQVELALPAERVRSMTMDLSARSFTTLLAKPLPEGTTVKCSLRVSGEHLACEATVKETKRQPHNVRATFALTGLEQADSDRLELVVFDEVLARLGAPR